MFVGCFFDCVLQLQQVVEVLLQFFGVVVEVGGVYDQVYVGWCVEVVQGFVQFVVFFVFDMVGDVVGVWVVWYQYQVMVGQVDEGGQGGVFVVVFFFFDLDDDFLVFVQDFFDVDLVFGGFFEVFVGDFFEGEEVVVFGVEVDEGGFEVGFDVSDVVFVDVGFFLFVGV